MNNLQRAIIEKVGHDNGYEHVLVSDAQSVELASACHPARVIVLFVDNVYHVRFHSGPISLMLELLRSFPQSASTSTEFIVSSEAALAVLMRRAANLSCALPSQAATNYQKAVTEELEALPAAIIGTEIERLVRQRVGQRKFRDAMMNYWGGACAVTGVALPEVLRASHAKPWADCESDAERLDVFNGFLLSANLDALFDRFLISFDEYGQILISNALSDTDKQLLNLGVDLKLRWVTPQHQAYLAYHHSHFKIEIISN